MQRFPVHFIYLAILLCLPSFSSFAIVPALHPVTAIELPPHKVKPIAPHELSAPYLKPIAAIELKPIAVKEAPYEEETKQTEFALNEGKKTPVPDTPKVLSTFTTVKNTSLPSLVLKPKIAASKDSKPSDYDPQSY